MASLNPSQHLESNIIPSNGHLSSSEPDLHLHLDQSIRIPRDDDKEPSPTANKPHATPSKELLNSIRNTANKIARKGSRKLRTLSVKKSPPQIRPKRDEKSASSSSLPSPPSPKHNDNEPNESTEPKTQDTTLDAAKRKVPKNILLHRFNKRFNIARQKSNSNPNSPIEPQQKHNKQNYDLGTSNIVIGATYSHSDNERIDTKLKSMRRKKSRTNFLNKQRAKRGNINLDVHAQRTNDKDVSDTKSGQDIRMRLEEKEKEYDGDDGYAHTEPLEAKAIADKAVIRKIYDSSIVHVLTHRAEDEAALCYVENFVQYRHRNKPLIIDLSSVENMLRVIVQ
eukprot:196187_1